MLCLVRWLIVVKFTFKYFRFKLFVTVCTNYFSVYYQTAMFDQTKLIVNCASTVCLCTEAENG